MPMAQLNKREIPQILQEIEANFHKDSDFIIDEIAQILQIELIDKVVIVKQKLHWHQFYSLIQTHGAIIEANPPYNEDEKLHHINV